LSQINSAIFPGCLLFEDDYILVVNKPSGLMVEPDRNGHPNLLHEVKKYLKSAGNSTTIIYAQHIHRLDRPVSGIILFAKQRAVLSNLSNQFATRSVKKYYQALTSSASLLQEGTLEHWHRKEKKKAVLYHQQVEFSEKVSLSYSVTTRSDSLFLWNIELHTGKYHQIRAQLAGRGCPILGDALYGSTDLYKADAIALHACQLNFNHPISGERHEVICAAPFAYDGGN
jgi:RluA family pseudouridine synthase